MISLHHGGPNGASLRLAIALEELQLPYRAVAVQLAQLEHWSARHRAVAGDSSVPVLVDGSLLMTDSAISLLYLAEAYPSTSLFPQTPAERYRSQALIDTLDVALLDSINLLGWQRTTKDHDRRQYLQSLADIPQRVAPAGWSAVWSDAENDLLARAEEKMLEGLTTMEGILRESSWLTGNHYGVTDISAFALTRTVPSLLGEETLRARFAHVSMWRDTVAERGAVARALTHVGGELYAPPI